jgi:OOP family OmpA-OmpF porin
MINNTLRSAGLGAALLALAVLVGCATTEEPPPPTPAPAPAPATPAPAPAPAPAPKPEAKPAPKPVPVAQKVTLAADVLFDFDKSVVKPEFKDRLDTLAGQIRDINLEVVIAIGHADQIGGTGYNQKLSVRRAEAVKAYLVSKGLEANRVYTEGKGETQPVKACPKMSGKALIECLYPNRRVELEVIGTKK